MPITYKEDGSIKRPNMKIAYDKAMLANYAACSKSVKYFAENYYYIIDPVEGKQIIELRDYQLRILENFEQNRFNILLSARQIGKTTCSAIYILWYCCFNADKTVAILANKADTAKSILSEIKMAYELLPAWLKPGVVEYNAFNVKFDNGCTILAKATSPDALRGESISLLFLDEFAFVPQNFAEDFWQSNYPTLSTGGACIIVSTPNGTSNLFYKLWKDAIDKNNSFNPIKVDWHEVPGRNEKWKEETIKNIGIIRFNQEYGCITGDQKVKILYDNKEFLVPIENLHKFSLSKNIVDLFK